MFAELSLRPKTLRNLPQKLQKIEFFSFFVSFL